MTYGSLSALRSRILSAAQANGCFVREENGQLIEVTVTWVSPLVGQMSKSACHYALLGISGRRDHTVIISRRQATALQSFADRKESSCTLAHDVV